MPIKSFITADKEGFLSHLETLAREHEATATSTRTPSKRQREYGIAEGLRLAVRMINNWDNLVAIVPEDNPGYRSHNAHDYQPDYTKTGDPCEVCGFGRGHSWHAVS